VADQEQIESPSWSPNGQWICFSMMSGRQQDIYIVSFTGTDLKNLTNDAKQDIGPCWSPAVSSK
jgi:Tol biopolymer transport system component